MKNVIFVVVTLALSVCLFIRDDQYRRLDSVSHLPGDFKIEKGVRGELFKKGSEEFFFKEAYFKIPDEYHFEYDSIQIILGWRDGPLVNPCYFKVRKNLRPDLTGDSKTTVNVCRGHNLIGRRLSARGLDTIVKYFESNGIRVTKVDSMWEPSLHPTSITSKPLVNPIKTRKIAQ